MTDYVHVLCVTDYSLSNGAEWLNIKFSKPWCSQAVFERTSNMGDENIEIT
jgi:hypothetical protein